MKMPHRVGPIRITATVPITDFGGTFIINLKAFYQISVHHIERWPLSEFPTLFLNFIVLQIH